MLAQIRIISVGKLKESYFLAAQAEYVKRLKPYARLEMVELPDQPCPEGASPAMEEQIREKEATLIRGHLKEREFIVALDRQGKEFSSIELAEFIRERENRSDSIAFIIGGSLGIAGSLLKEAQLKLSFSKLTFPHQLFRVILLEQLYRAAKINRGEKYHK